MELLVLKITSILQWCRVQHLLFTGAFFFFKEYLNHNLVIQFIHCFVYCVWVCLCQTFRHITTKHVAAHMYTKFLHHHYYFIYFQTKLQRQREQRRHKTWTNQIKVGTSFFLGCWQVCVKSFVIWIQIVTTFYRIKLSVRHKRIWTGQWPHPKYLTAVPGENTKLSVKKYVSEF